MRARTALASFLMVSVCSFASAEADTANGRFEPSRPFLFSITTAPAPERRWTIQYQGGYAERTSTPFGYDGVEHRLALQGSLAAGLTLLGDFGLGQAGTAGTQSLQQIELLKDVLHGGGLHLAMGAGVRREWDGTKALLGRVTIGHAFAASALHANLCFERPLAENRDEIDVITTLGWSRRLSSTTSLALELVGEDLEGLWEAEEAEGGARVFLGPSLRVAPRSGRLSLTAGGGPVLRVTRSGRTSAAPRPIGNRSGYSVKLALTYLF